MKFEDFEAEPLKTPEQISLEIVKAQKEMEEAQGELPIFDEEIALAEAEIKPLDDEIKEMQEKLRELQLKKEKLQIDKANIKNKQKDVWWKKDAKKKIVLKKKEEIAHLQAELHKVNMHELEAKKMAEQGEELEKAAQSFAWYNGALKHQKDAAKQMAVLNKVILGDDMGLGKSLTSLMAADLSGARKILIISKIEVVTNFANEVSKWAPHRQMVFCLPGHKKFFQKHMLENVLTHLDDFVVLLNFETYWSDKDIVPLLNKLQFDTVIFDEAHHMKEAKGNTFKGFKQLLLSANKCFWCGHNELKYAGIDSAKGLTNTYRCLNEQCGMVMESEDTHSIKRIWPMTGSPILNRPDEIWPLLYCIDPVQFPSIEAFHSQYCRKEEYVNLRGNMASRWTFRFGGSDRLLKAIGPQFIRRTKEDAGIEIPPQEITVIKVPFTEQNHPLQWNAYQDLEQYVGMLFDADGEGRAIAGPGGGLVTRLRQVTSWPAGIKIYETDPVTFEVDKTKIAWECDIHESAKMDAAFAELVDKFLQGQRVVIFAKHTAVIDEMNRRAKEWEGENGERMRPAIYAGGNRTPMWKREQIKIDFDRSRWDPHNYQFDVLICQNELASQGLNFTAASHMQILERMWNPKLEEQMVARVARIGQTLETSVSIFELEDTIDDAINLLLADKKIDISKFEESAESIRELLAALFKRAKSKHVTGI